MEVLGSIARVALLLCCLKEKSEEFLDKRTKRKDGEIICSFCIFATLTPQREKNDETVGLFF